MTVPSTSADQRTWSGYLGQDIQAYLDAKYKGSLTKDWDEFGKPLLTQHVLFHTKGRVELQFDGLRHRCNLQSYTDTF